MSRPTVAIGAVSVDGQPWRVATTARKPPDLPASSSAGAQAAACESPHSRT